MMGATLNSSSAAAKEMDMVLKSEIAAHSAYDPNARPTYHGVPLPGRKQVCISKQLNHREEKSLVFSERIRISLRSRG